MVFYTTGQIITFEALLLLAPLVVSLIYKDGCALPLLISVGTALVTGLLLLAVAKPHDHIIYAREGLLIVALAWLSLSALGALPFYISREIPSYVDAFFETVSGFTTTGASILTDVEAMSPSLLFWRSLTHWVGGMGVLVFVMAVIPNMSDRSIHIMRAEMPGPIIGKLVPRVKQTARILYLIYVVLTAVQVIFLLFGGMSLFDSLLHAFGTAGTGGFGIKSDSIASYSPYLQWVITVFMLIFGLNFNLFYLLLIKRVKNAFSSTEMWVYLSIVAVSTAIITFNTLPMTSGIGESIRSAAFQVASIITTTGYSTIDFNLWPTLSKTILLVLMFIGGCAGSTAGGLKVSRVVILFKMLRSEFKRMIHPRSVRVVKFEGKVISEATLGSVGIYLAIYIFCLFAIFLAISFEPFDIETNFSAAVSCFNNVGPGLSAVGPMSSYAGYSPFSTLVLSFAMLLGRLEIFPLLIALSPFTWSKK